MTRPPSFNRSTTFVEFICGVSWSRYGPAPLPDQKRERQIMSLPNSLFVFGSTGWLQLHALAGSLILITEFLFHWGEEGYGYNVCIIQPHDCTCQMASEFIEQFKKHAQCDRQTDHAMKKCVGRGGIADQFRLKINAVAASMRCCCTAVSFELLTY